MHLSTPSISEFNSHGTKVSRSLTEVMDHNNFDGTVTYTIPKELLSLNNNSNNNNNNNIIINEIRQKKVLGKLTSVGLCSKICFFWHFFNHIRKQSSDYVKPNVLLNERGECGQTWPATNFYPLVISQTQLCWKISCLKNVVVNFCKFKIIDVLNSFWS